MKRDMELVKRIVYALEACPTLQMSVRDLGPEIGMPNIGKVKTEAGATAGSTEVDPRLRYHLEILERVDNCA